MSSPIRGTGRQYWVALRSMILLTIVLGIAYPLVITGIGQLTMPGQSNGSTVQYQGKVVGSSLIGQGFTTKKGAPLTQWFQSRPSAAGDGWNAEESSPSNLGPNNPVLVKEIQQRRAVIEKTYGVTAAQIPPDAVTASGSGLDPDISPAYAQLQIDTIAKTRGISAASVRKLVDEHTAGRELGYLGNPTVNVLQLNIALAELDPSGND
jgi:potassium-transporting ATPase KdpC subunit